MVSPEVIGWREWIALPGLDIQYLKCKVDTGARTSALHAYFVEPDNAANRVRFGIHPIQKREDVSIICTSEFLETRMVTDSGGHRERRYVIVTDIVLAADKRWSIEVTLTNRDTMRFQDAAWAEPEFRRMYPGGSKDVSYLTRGKPDFSRLLLTTVKQEVIVENENCITDTSGRQALFESAAGRGGRRRGDMKWTTFTR